MIKVAFLHASYKIQAFINNETHTLHELDAEYSTPRNFHFTPQQEKIIEEGIEARSTNFFIWKRIKAEMAHTNNQYPSRLQIGTKKRNMKKKNMKYNIVNYLEMRSYAESKSAVPDDDDECYVVFYLIDEDSGRFTLIWLTKNLMKRMKQRLTSADATYKLNWMDFPVFVSGVSSPAGVFYQTHMALSSHEDQAAWRPIFGFVKSIIGKSPEFVI